MTADRSRLSILILHRLGDPLAWRTAVRDLEYLLPDHLPEHGQIGCHSIKFLSTAARNTEPRNHLVKNQKRIVVRAFVTQDR